MGSDSARAVNRVTVSHRRSRSKIDPARYAYIVSQSDTLFFTERVSRAPSPCELYPLPKLRSVRGILGMTKLRDRLRSIALAVATVLSAGAGFAGAPAPPMQEIRPG